MSVTVKVKGINRARNNVRTLTRKVQNNADLAVEQWAKKVQRESVRRIKSPPKTGRVYSRSGGRTHRASAPGESPAEDTGALSRSIRVRGRKGSLRRRIGSRLIYAWWETGIRGQPERPYLRPSLRAKKREGVLGVVRALRSTFR